MLTEREQQLAEAVASGDKPIATICQEHGISRQGYYKKVKSNPAFKCLVRDLQEANRAEALRVLHTGAHKAAAALVAAAEGRNRLTATRLAAINSLLDRVGLAAKNYEPAPPANQQPLTVEEVQAFLKSCQEKEE